MEYTNFNNLPEKKKIAIINAGFSCFGEHGYKKTGVAEIAEMAGISKAAVFYYFGSKKELFFYLFDYIHDILMKETTEGTEDFIESWKIAMYARHRIAKTYSGFYTFLKMISRKKDFDQFPELWDVVTKNNEIIFEKLFKNVDWNCLNEACSSELVMNIMGWISEGLMNMLSGEESEDEILKREEQYYRVMKKAFYKPEYLECMEERKNEIRNVQ